MSNFRFLLYIFLPGVFVSIAGGWKFALGYLIFQGLMWFIFNIGSYQNLLVGDAWNVINIIAGAIALIVLAGMFVWPTFMGVWLYGVIYASVCILFWK